MNDRNIRCDFVFFDAGGGHRSAANALRAVMERESYRWEIRMVNLQEVLASVDVLHKVTGVHIQEVYNRIILKRNLTIAAPQLNVVLRSAIRMFHSQEVKLLEAHWNGDRPDLVVSLVPHFNRAMLEGLRRVSPTIPYVTIMTDIADYSPHFWIEPQPQFLICGSQRAVEQAHELGFPETGILQTSGMIIHPSFYDPLPMDRNVERKRLGLDPELPTGLIMFGGQGSRSMLEIFRCLRIADVKIQLIFLCGHNAEMERELKIQCCGFPAHVTGFTREVPYYMQLSDFFIGKPGPGSISEALAMHLPVIVECNARTLPQERYNARWIQEKQVGMVISSFRSIASAVEQMMQTETLHRFRANAAALRNRAVFEIPGLLKGLLPERCADQ
jgi:UDP-N-acetylglucosamine:LPS N-acetylglucosamine transferase